MIVRDIVYAKKFLTQWKRLPEHIQAAAKVKEQLFIDNPLHPSLRLHPLRGKLNGLWSLSITDGYRIILEPQDNGEIFFISIGTHDIYRNI